MLLGTLGADFLMNLLSGKEVVRSGGGVIWAVYRTIRVNQDF